MPIGKTSSGDKAKALGKSVMEDEDLGDAGRERASAAAGRARGPGRALRGDQGAPLPRKRRLQPRPAGGGELARDRADLRGRRLRHRRRGDLQGDVQVLLRLGAVPDRRPVGGQLRQRGIRGRPAAAGAVARDRAVAQRALRPEGPRAPVPEGRDRRCGRRLSQCGRPHRHPVGRPAGRGPGTRVQTFVEDGFRFRCYVDPLGTSRYVAVPGDPVIAIVAGPPERIQLGAPVSWRRASRRP